MAIVGGLGLTAIGWIGYLPFVAGFPGCYWLAWGYGHLVLVTLPLMLVAFFTLPAFGMALGILALVSTVGQWRHRARQGAKTLLMLLLAELLAIIALLPNAVWQFETYDQVAIAPWHVIYRAAYVAPLDNNYGHLMLLKCHWLGLCYQVYRSDTDITSAEDVNVEYNVKTNEVALHLEGRWVYVRSPGEAPCHEQLRGFEYGECRFERE